MRKLDRQKLLRQCVFYDPDELYFVDYKSADGITRRYVINSDNKTAFYVILEMFSDFKISEVMPKHIDREHDFGEYKSARVNEGRFYDEESFWQFFDGPSSSCIEIIDKDLFRETIYPLPIDSAANADIVLIIKDDSDLSTI